MISVSIIIITIHLLPEASHVLGLLVWYVQEYDYSKDYESELEKHSERCLTATMVDNHYNVIH